MAPSCSTLQHQPISSGLPFGNSWNSRSGVGIPHSMQGEERGSDEEEQQLRGSNLPSSSSSEGTWDFGRPVQQSSFSFSLDPAPRSANQESTEKEPLISYSKSSKDSLIAIIDKALNILEGDDDSTSDGEDSDENYFGAYHLDTFPSS